MSEDTPEYNAGKPETPPHCQPIAPNTHPSRIADQLNGLARATDNPEVRVLAQAIEALAYHAERASIAANRRPRF